MNKINIYLKINNKYLRHAHLEIKKSGLYFFDNTDKGDHFSYHADGHCFYHSFGKRNIKKIRKPLKDFTETESLRSVNVILQNDVTKYKGSVNIGSGDVIIERNAPFCFEVILSKDLINLPSCTERKNVQIFQRSLGGMCITFEVFDIINNSICDLRYSPNKWVAGKNYFTWIDNQWQ